MAIVAFAPRHIDTAARLVAVASHLLDAALAWAREAGYARWAVDHESANREAGRFWGRHATPAAVSMSRRLPPRPGA